MEYLEGETLEQRLKKGALPLDQALQVGIQIADALAAAHRAGIVHRDLKPGNIMLTKSGAKLLDFGLAKTGVPAVAGSLSMLPTTPPNLTVQGTILGTFQYMAPEQLEGLEADARSDIFAFGSVLYEMITGGKAFKAKSHASLVAAILEHEPPALSTVHGAVPRPLEHVVRQCLAKSADDRWQTASDLHRELKWAAESIGHDAVSSTHTTRHPAARWQRPIALGAAVAAVFFAATIAAVIVWGLTRTTPAVASGVARLTIVLPTGQELGLTNLDAPAVAISPSGTHVAYVAMSRGRQELHVRTIDSVSANALAGTEGATNPFFSPDGQWIGFFAQGKLRKVAIAAGITQTLCDAPSGRGGSWAPDGTIYFAATNSAGLSTVSANGGTPTEVTRLDRAKGEVSHRWPHVLPGGRAVMFTVFRAPAGTSAKFRCSASTPGSAPSSFKGAIRAAMFSPVTWSTRAGMSCSPYLSISIVYRCLDKPSAWPIRFAARARVLTMVCRTLERSPICPAALNDTSAVWSG